jgi:hypothetical protein
VAQQLAREPRPPSQQSVSRKRNDYRHSGSDRGRSETVTESGSSTGPSGARFGSELQPPGVLVLDVVVLDVVVVDRVVDVVVGDEVVETDSVVCVVEGG